MRNPCPLLAAVVAALACLGPAGSARADLITNGDFETGDFSGWTLSGNTADPTTFGVDASNPHGGNYAAYFGPQGSEVFLSQTFATTVGGSYAIDFFLMNEDGTSPNEFSLAFGSKVLVDTSDLATFPYQEVATTATATAATTTLTFGFRSDFAFFDLDDISVSSVVPEPGSLACLATGVVLAACRGRRRRAARATDPS